MYVKGVSGLKCLFHRSIHKAAIHTEFAIVTSRFSCEKYREVNLDLNIDYVTLNLLSCNTAVQTQLNSIKNSPGKKSLFLLHTTIEKQERYLIKEQKSP